LAEILDGMARRQIRVVDAVGSRLHHRQAVLRLADPALRGDGAAASDDIRCRSQPTPAAMIITGTGLRRTAANAPS